MKIVLIGVFGLLGIYTRYFIDTIFTFKNDSFPYSTLLVNLIGCSITGVLFYYLESKAANPYILPLIIGLCGGLTTFSSYCLQGFQLLSQGDHLKAFAYLVLSPTLGLTLVFTTYIITSHFSS